jgi:hypothetical protein
MAGEAPTTTVSTRIEEEGNGRRELRRRGGPGLHCSFNAGLKEGGGGKIGIMADGRGCKGAGEASGRGGWICHAGPDWQWKKGRGKASGSHEGQLGRKGKQASCLVGLCGPKQGKG